MRFPPLLTRGSVLAPNLRRGEPAPLPSLAPERCERGRKGLPLPPARPCHHRRERAGGPHLGFSRVLLPVSAQSLGLSLRWSRSPALVVLPRTQVESPSRAPRLELSPVLSTGTYLHVLPPTALCLVPLPRQLASTSLRPPGPPHVTTARPSPLRPPPLSPAPWTAIRASPPPRRLMTPPLAFRPTAARRLDGHPRVGHVPRLRRACHVARQGGPVYGSQLGALPHHRMLLRVCAGVRV